MPLTFLDPFTIPTDITKLECPPPFTVYDSKFNVIGCLRYFKSKKKYMFQDGKVMYDSATLASLAAELRKLNRIKKVKNA